MNPYVYLAGAIVLEVIATSLLKASEGMTRLGPRLGALAGYGVCFYLLSLSLTMKSIPTGIAYAIWSGVGIVLISLIGLLVFKQRLDAPALIGIGLICAGVLVINLFSHSSAH
ncbi:SMR family transporter [Stenotrophomonas indicatrix]|uniref:SMR family transporter n=1 Tax=Stenotrophomonas indicatrix TaxID=2045451 RepID=UPI000C1840E7|nr:SMR family transporter [Stenotrophomonas indicatrix]PII12470.1 QacE family quaternary ammonium compound efflux SMR transporter [Stenotrophomonas indicatrix]